MRLRALILAVTAAIGLPVFTATAKERFRTGFPAAAISNIDIRDARVAFDVWVRKIATRMNYDYSTEIYPDEEQLEKELMNGDVDFGLMFTHRYLALKDPSKVRPILVPTRNTKEPFDHYQLLVKASSGLTSIEQLQGKRLIMDNGNRGELPILWLDDVLAGKKLGVAEKFFAETKQVSDASKAILPVFFGQADAAVVTKESLATAANLNPQLGKQLVPLATSEPFIALIACVRSGISASEVKRITDIACDLQSLPEGRQVLLLTRTARVLRFNPAWLENVRALLKRRGRLTSESDTKAVPVLP